MSQSKLPAKSKCIVNSDGESIQTDLYGNCLEGQYTLDAFK